MPTYSLNWATNAQPRQSLLKVAWCVAVCLLLRPPAGYAQAPNYDAGYVGINNDTGFNTDPVNVQNNVNLMKKIGLGSARMGIDGVGGRSTGSTFNWTNRDAAVTRYLEGGIEIRAVFDPRAHADRGASFEDWKANWNYFVRGVLNRYKGKITYYITGNEPELNFGQGVLTPQEAFEMNKIAFLAARDIDPNIRIESMPPISPESDMLRQLIQLGVGNYCDFIGIHCYGSQITDDRLNRPFVWLRQYGTTPKPLSASESGVNPGWKPAGMDGQEWRRRWQPQWYLALKRYGYAHGMLFSLTGGEAAWEYYTSSFTPVYQPLEDEIKDKSFRNNSLDNGGFERTNDPEREWIVYYNPDNLNPPTHTSFVTGDAAGARTGSGYVRMNTGSVASGTDLIVRRVAGRLPAGSEVTVGGWAYVSGGGSATLKALGYDKLNGDAATVATSSGTGTWQYLSVTVPVTQGWVVVELSTKGTAAAGQFVKWDDVSLSYTEKGDGLKAEYFGSRYLTDPKITRVDPAVNFNWGTGSPGAGVGADNFSARWTGEVKPAYSETYTFYTNTDDGVRLWVNDRLLIDKWVDQGATEWSGTISLSAGQRYAIRLEYYENGGGASARLLWSSPSQAKGTIPQSRLFSTPAPGDGLTGEYYDNMDLTAFKIRRLDKTVNFTWGAGAPDPSIAADTYSARWTGTVMPRYSQTYTFYTATDDGVRLWVDGQLLVDKWVNQAATEWSGSIPLVAGRKYDIKMEYFENGGDASAGLQWSSSSQPREVIPQSRLFAGKEAPLSVARRAFGQPEAEEGIALYPNPANEQITLLIPARQEGRVRIEVTDLLAQPLLEAERELKAGTNRITVPLRRLSSGLYLVNITVDGRRVVKKVQLLK